ncbi:hypothetical protein F2P81_018286 [Scophthalmus maximus]|uniref:Ubiquitin-like domain-containing protein n=1 Tax=Scophthalmus maximus TaxID=52904 RepID=A0A6A4SDJ0_SCOMX|nr:hypothetical protein F2P81_018286 [Scophthalmus maximus]
MRGERTALRHRHWPHRRDVFSPKGSVLPRIESESVISLCLPPPRPLIWRLLSTLDDRSDDRRQERSELARHKICAQTPKMGKIYQVVVHGLRGEKMTVDLCNTEEQMQTMTVLQLRERIAQKLPNNADKMLDDDATLLSQYGIQHMSVIHMVLRVPGGLTA